MIKSDKDFVKLYSMSDLAKIDRHHPLTIRNWKRYIKVRFTDGQKQAKYKAWATKSPYGYKYIRRDDVKAIAEKQFWKKIIFSDK